MKSYLRLMLLSAFIVPSLLSCTKEESTKEEKNQTIVYQISLDKEVLNLIVGQTSELHATITPVPDNENELIWSSSNPSVTSVKEGIVTALQAGTTVITVSIDKYMASCSVTVSPKEVESLLKSIDTEIMAEEDGKCYDFQYSMNFEYDDNDRLCLLDREFIDNDGTKNYGRVVIDYSLGSSPILVCEGSCGPGFENQLERYEYTLSYNDSNQILLVLNNMNTGYFRMFDYNAEGTVSRITVKDRNANYVYKPKYTNGNLSFYPTDKDTVKYNSEQVKENVFAPFMFYSYYGSGDEEEAMSIALNIINGFPGNANLPSSYRGYTFEYVIDEIGRVVTMHAKSDERTVHNVLRYTYVESGSQHYVYNPYTVSGMGGTTWKYDTETGETYYIVFVDESSFYYIEPQSRTGSQYMKQGFYSRKNSVVTLTFVKNGNTKVSTGALDGESITVVGGDVKEGVYSKTDNILI